MALSQEIKTKIDDMRKVFPTSEALLIPLLHAIQEEKGHISRDSMKEAAVFLQLPFKKIREVVTFYTMFNEKPMGKVHLQFCTNIACWLKGADHLLHCAEKRLGIKCGETTPDGQFTISEVECLAACGTAPVVQVNDLYCENLDEKKLLELIDNAKAKEQKRQ
ncbi:MAG: NAD(P)H-dependent oxidoreductase subunit E [Pseudomonadota bacterium]